ncbi:phenylacetate--CoA ligase family protein [Streptomyces sp. ICN988]|uniref:phenylacetate--CoA ligase family protein n=1 Tax=Streptomyces sp. ICN988 TaxID=2983765 RepID=UPI0021E46AAA|nr:phenylacetate--CoA ligase family protein [Streptomyces sp. ICN988]MCV2458634.1 phenylacetate--CoA ligase family protein [Streptomyces sp. ICN988]
MSARHVDPRFRDTYASFTGDYLDGTLDARRWDAWDTERLRAVVRHVRASSPFYRRHLAAADVDGLTPRSLEQLPYTTKDDLRRELLDVLCAPVSEALVYYETTGTTGASTPCPRDAKDVFTSDLHVEEACRRLFAARYGDRMPMLGLMGPSELYAFGDTFGEVAQRLGASHVKIWPESPRVGFQKALRLMHQLDVEVVVGAPALCLGLAKAARHYGYDLRRDFKVDLFLVLGEICTPAFARNVASLWGADTLPILYGSQEALAVATGCAEGRLHLSRPNYLPEVIDPATGRSLGRTGEGELVLTMLIDGIKPLVRYRTGDHVRLTDERCACGRPGPQVAVTGRVADHVTVGGRRLRPADLEEALLDGVRGCLGYQIVVDPGPDGADRVTVRLELLPDHQDDAAAVAAATAQRLVDRCGVRAAVELTADLDPVTHTGAFVSWKAARFQDNRAEPDHEVRAARQAAVRHLLPG